MHLTKKTNVDRERNLKFLRDKHDSDYHASDRMSFVTKMIVPN